ncbi:hypothetical protein ALP22_01745 [Pseudomonas coronafaciens pv. porri]|uniref:hypothetical protein n=1 Tax=Pseudomonas syringae group TaxID=136849 RepID=UPI000AEFFAF3|nr:MULTISPECIES: hypothetical protein [Pseudomonas syringae group]RMU87276.1 hypothetical protein ALP22_01745 [Pseudomonas coronafaciens pv. porri]
MSSYDGKANVTFSGENLKDGDIFLDSVHVKYDLQGWDFVPAIAVRTRVGGTLYVHVGHHVRSEHADHAVVLLLDGPDSGVERNFNLGSNNFERNVRTISNGWLEVHIR